jgi:DNA-binding transcriptional regulator YhcF (GntR family)
MARKFEQIAEDLRGKIRDGVYRPGSRLPSHTTLATRYHVHLMTVRRAVDLLNVEGLIDRRHGVGTFVRESSDQIDLAYIPLNGDQAMELAEKLIDGRPFRIDLPADPAEGRTRPMAVVIRRVIGTNHRGESPVTDLTAATWPDDLRVSRVLRYLSPDGRCYMAPLGTPHPDPDQPLSPAWLEITVVPPNQALD